MKSLKFVGLLMLLVAFAAPAFAQSDRGTILGTVTDPGGAVVVGAKITATDLNTGEVREATTSDAGTYTLPELKANPYKVAVEAQGFKTSTLENVQVTVQGSRRVDIQLELGQISEAVTVTSDAAPIIQADTPVRQTNVTERQVRELPLQVSAESGGRTPLAFIFLDSSVTSTSGSSGRGTDASNFRVSGGQGLGTDILIDGASTRRAQNGTFFSEVAPGPNAYQEFTLSTSSYSAEFGSSSGGIVNFTLKSGTNEIHGEAYDLIRNNALNANSYFNNANNLPIQRDHEHNFGFNIGGPVWLPRSDANGKPSFIKLRNRLFYFFNYEGFRFARSETVDITVPTLKMRSGDFSELFTDPYIRNFRFNDGFQPWPNGIQIYNPHPDQFTREPIPGNRLDQYLGGSLLDPAGLALANLYPVPTRAGVFNNYRATSETPTYMNNYVGKIDFIVSEKHRLAGSYSFREQDSIKSIGDSPAFPRFGGTFIASFNGNGPFFQHFKSYFARIQDDYSFSPTLLNHFNIGFTRYDTTNRNFSEGIPASSIGFPANATQNAALPRIGFPNYGDINGDCSVSRDPRCYQGAGSSFFTDHLLDNTVQITDFVTWVKGRHTMKFGGDLRIQQLNVHQLTDPGGSFNFQSDQTTSAFDPLGGWPIASLVTGATEFSFVNIHSIDPGWRYFYPSFFFSDDIKVTPRLTLNVGIRYEIPYPRVEARDRFRGFDPDVRNPAAANRLGAIVGAGNQGGLDAEHRGLAAPDYSNIGPRFGFAYSINDKTVVRGGYGLYYAPILYGLGGANSITEGLIGYNSTAGPFQGRNGFDRQAKVFLSTQPPAPPINPNGQFTGSDVEYFNKDFKTGRTAQWSLDIQRELPGRIAVSAGYTGHRGTRLRSNFSRLNALPLNALKLGFPLLNKRLADVTAPERAFAQGLGFTIPANNAAVYPCFGSDVAPCAEDPARATVAQALKPFPQYGRINNQLEGQGQSWYHALQLKIDRRFAQGFQFGASYTFSKLITNASEDLFGGGDVQTVGSDDRSGIAQNIYDRQQLRAVSPSHPYHVFVLNYLVELPFGRGKRFFDRGGIVNTLFGGWQISGIHRYQSGLPLVILNSEPGNVAFLGLVGFQGNLRPNLTGQPILTGNPETGTTFGLVNRAAFSNPPNFQTPPTGDVTDPAYAAYYANPLRFFGDAPTVLDKERIFPYYSENFTLMKKTRLAETVIFEVRLEFFNLFNRHRYVYTTNDLRFGDFGTARVINNPFVYGPRTGQVGLKLIF